MLSQRNACRISQGAPQAFKCLVEVGQHTMKHPRQACASGSTRPQVCHALIPNRSHHAPTAHLQA